MKPIPQTHQTCHRAAACAMAAAGGAGCAAEEKRRYAGRSAHADPFAHAVAFVNRAPVSRFAGQTQLVAASLPEAALVAKLRTGPQRSHLRAIHCRSPIMTSGRDGEGSARERPGAAGDGQQTPKPPAKPAAGDEPLLASVLAGEVGAWQALMVAWAPRLRAMARGHRGLRTRNLVDEDELAEVVTLTFERLRRRDFASLRRFAARRAEERAPQSLDSWLYGALDFSVRSHLRTRFGRAPQAVPGRTGPPRLSRRDVGSFAARLPIDDVELGPSPVLGVTDRLTLAEIMRAVASDFSPSELRAFTLHYERGVGAAEIAADLGLVDQRAAERMIRRLNARLRYRFSR